MWVKRTFYLKHTVWGILFTYDIPNIAHQCFPVLGSKFEKKKQFVLIKLIMHVLKENVWFFYIWNTNK